MQLFTENRRGFAALGLSGQCPDRFHFLFFGSRFCGCNERCRSGSDFPEHCGVHGGRYGCHLGELLWQSVAEPDAEYGPVGFAGHAFYECARELADLPAVPPVEVTNVNSIQTFIQAVIDHYGRIDVLINNAGYNKLAKIIDYDESQYDLIVDANLKNVFFCS